MICAYCNQDTECRSYGLERPMTPMPIYVHEDIHVCDPCEPAFRQQLAEFTAEVKLLPEPVGETRILLGCSNG